MVMAEIYDQRSKRKYSKKDREKEDDNIFNNNHPMKILSKPNSNNVKIISNMEAVMNTNRYDMIDSRLASKDSRGYISLSLKPKKELYDPDKVSSTTTINSNYYSGSSNIGIGFPDNRTNLKGGSNVSKNSSNALQTKVTKLGAQIKDKTNHENSGGLMDFIQKELSKSIKIIDETFNWVESTHGNEMLADYSNFLVVGVLGMQGVGKSTVLSYLAGNNNERRSIFSIGSQSSLESDLHQTVGIDMYATEDRLILLDTQALMSSSYMLDVVQQERKYSADFLSLESGIEVQSLQITSFFMTVCNVIVVVLDWFIDDHIIRLLQVSEMLKPISTMDSTNNDEKVKAPTPYIIFVLNKTSVGDYDTRSLIAMDMVIKSFMQNSKLKYFGLDTIRKSICSILANKKQMSCDMDKSNLFLLPCERVDERNEAIKDLFLGSQVSFTGKRMNFEDKIKEMRNCILSLPGNLSFNKLTEVKWLQFANKAWELVRKSQLFPEYNRLIST